uniref:NADH dehydrogenase subunit 6 n=1 Tax=Hydaropsis longirostris TaxID=498947 RepID=B7SMD7_HYDLO|nr:NADH dehydrogenase subunit 6 [Hydaropsis longirostris]ABZ02030.1 NADH dehydrogenase subunit 6 [Hydaropsis longirostris]
MKMLIMTLLTLSMNFLWLKHPISMGVLIIIQTISIAMLSGMMSSTFWFSYIITITMLSGMLVLFIYMASVASNEMISVSIKMIIMTIVILSLGLILQNMDNYEDIFINKTNQEKIKTISLNPLFNMKHKFITMMMITYLLFSMITISFIVNITEGPLRINKK